MRHLILAALLAFSSPEAASAPHAMPVPSFPGIAAAIERGEVPDTKSVLVMRGGQILHESYFGGADVETLHNTRSAGKSITALAVGIAIDRGLVPGVDALVFPYLSDLAPFAHGGPLKDAITFEDFLTMSSALDCNDDDAKSPGNEENLYPLDDWARFAVDIPVKADYRRDASGRGPWSYCTAGTFLLGQAVQRAAKQPIDEFMAEHLFKPLGISRWEFFRSKTGEVFTGGGLSLRTRDWAAIAEAVRSGGVHQGKQVVPREFVREALTIHRRAYDDPPTDYGYLFWRFTYRTPCGDFGGWSMAGNGGNRVTIVEKLDTVIVVTRTHFSQPGMHQQTASLIEKHILPELACAAGQPG
jgi:CubicO group peptidase (beta-lactamase class C family)